jgi:starch phosphorylase
MPSRPLRTFTVLPHLPDRLQGLQQLAYNLWWCWNQDAQALFTQIDPQKFARAENSPVKLLASVGQERLEQLAQDDGFLALMDRVVESLRHYLNAHTWFQETYG